MQSCCGRVFAEEASFDAHQDKVHPHPYRLTIRYPHELERELANLVEYARAFSSGERKKAASGGSAMKDGSFPIESVQDLKNAIKAVGRASNPASAKAHIKKRAKALGKENLLPDDWAAVGQGIQGAPSYITDPETPDPALKFTCPYCGRKFASQVALDFHEETSHADRLPAGQRSGASDGNSAHASQEQADKPDSWNDIQSLVREALVDKYRDPTQNYCYVWVADIGDDWVVFEFKDEYYRQSYAVDDNSNVTFSGRPVEVVRRTVYQVVQDTEDDDDLDDADSSAATGHKKKKNGRAESSHQKNGHHEYVLGNGPVVTPNMDPDNDGDVDTPGQPDNDVKTS